MNLDRVSQETFRDLTDGMQAAVINAKLDRIIATLTKGNENMGATGDGLEKLQKAVEEGKTVQESVETLINLMCERFRAVANDPAKVNTLADRFTALSDEFALAVTTNTDE